MTEVGKTLKIMAALHLAPVEWEATAERLTTDERDRLRQELELITERAGMFAAYLDERHGYGCGDQGHEKAIKAANKTGKIIWCKAFGYNGFTALAI